LSLPILLADLILFFHFLIVIFNVSGLVFIWIGYFFKWKWIRNSFFRYTHILLIVFVTINAFSGKYCPLTTWELKLRSIGEQEHYNQSFIQHLISSLIYVNISLKSLSFIYMIFLIMVIISLIFIKPDKIKSEILYKSLKQKLNLLK